MDDVDRGNEQAEQTLAAYIKAVRDRAMNSLQPTGQCHNCGEDQPLKLFCDADCRLDYDRRELMRRRSGA